MHLSFEPCERPLTVGDGKNRAPIHHAEDDLVDIDLVDDQPRRRSEAAWKLQSLHDQVVRRLPEEVVEDLVGVEEIRG